MFMHGSILHLAGNMLFLWIFGNNVEDAMGRVKFVAFYLLGGVAALAAADRHRTERDGPDDRRLGRDRRRARRLHPAVSAGARRDASSSSSSSSRSSSCRRCSILGLLVPAAGRLRLLGRREPDGRRGRRRVLRPHRRLRVRPAGDQALREPDEGLHRRRRSTPCTEWSRAAILGSALLFIAILATLTVVAVISGGVNVLTLVTLLVLALLGVGIVGALLSPPPDD